VDYYIHLGILVGIYLILSQSLNLVFGLGRLFNLAHVASYAIGAYTLALFSTELGLSFLNCLILALFFSALLAVPIAYISRRLSQDYFAIGTVAFSAVINALLINWKELTNGVLGISGIPRPAIGSFDFSENLAFLVLTWTIVLIAQGVLYILFRNGFSRRMRAQAEHERALEGLGCNPEQVRLMGFFVSSAFAGVAGAIFAAYLNYIDPSSFSFAEMVFVLTITVVGKPGSFWGAILATAFLVLLPEPLRFLELPPGILGPMRQLIYALILFGVVAWNRRTLFPVERQV